MTYQEQGGEHSVWDVQGGLGRIAFLNVGDCRAIGDHFVGADVFREAIEQPIEQPLGVGFGPVRPVMWAGTDTNGGDV